MWDGSKVELRTPINLQGHAGCQAEEEGHGEGAAEGGQEALQESARGVSKWGKEGSVTIWSNYSAIRRLGVVEQMGGAHKSPFLLDIIAV